jgi:hypothetical protein
MGAAATLSSHLNDPVILARRVAHELALVDGLRQGLFDVNVFARLAGQDHGDGMPVIRSGNNQPVDVLVFQNAAVVFFETGVCALGFGQLCASLAQDGIVDITERLNDGPVLDGIEGITATLVVAADRPPSPALACSRESLAAGQIN